MSDPSKIRVVIIENHTMVRSLLRRLLQETSDIEVVGDSEYAEEGLEIIKEQAPDVVLLDLVLDTSQITGLDALKMIAEHSPATRVIVLSAYSDQELAFPALHAGACGYMLKSASPNEVIEAVHDAAVGRNPMAPLITKKIMDALLANNDPLANLEDKPLTHREKEVVRLVSKGMSNQEIANSLTIAVPTVKTHVSNILQKLGLKDRTNIALWATQHPVA